MGSRLKENPDRTFYWFFEASCPIARDKDPDVLFQFPEDFSDEESRQTLPRFCFPYDIERVRDVVAVQHFTFVLTDLEGCQRFGFCRLTSSSHTCLCMLSYLPWFEVFYKLLNNLADYLTKGQTNEMRELLAALYTHPLPLAVGSVTLQLVPYFIAPDPRGLPSIPESRNLTELVVAVDVSNLLQLYASMLFERRILILSSKLSTLTACVHALSAVLYPMYWQHIFIPVLPPHLLDYCCAPMPFLIGVHSSLTERVRSRGLEEVVILNVDTNTIESPFDDLKKIPADVVSGLKLSLKRQAASAGVGVAKAFLRAQALLFGGYGDALKGNTNGQVMFCEEVFLDHRSPSMRQFLQSAVHLQLFKQFIDGRLELLNRGMEPDDLFEQEMLQCGTAEAGSTKAYHQLVGNLKKGGGALILNVKSKTHMYKSAKRGLRNFLSPKEQVEILSLKRGNSVSGTHTHRRKQSDCLQSRLPITQHFGKSRPRRPVNKQGCLLDDENTQENRDTWEEDWQDSAVSGPVADPELQEEEGGDSGMCDPEEMDLLGEIFDTLSARSSHDRGLLYGTRSLDLFGPDTTDYIRQRGLATPSQESLGVSIGGSGSLHSWNQEEGLHYMGEGPEQTDDSDCLGEGQALSEEASETPQGRREDGRREDGRREEGRREDGRREEGRREEGRREGGMREDGMREEGRREEGVEKGLVEAEELKERKEVGMERWNVLRQGGQDDQQMEERKRDEDITMEPKIQSECVDEIGKQKEVEGEKGREKMQNDRGKDQQQEDENQGQERGPKTPGELPRNRGPRPGTESRAGAGAVEDNQEEGDRLTPKTTAFPGPENGTATSASKQPLGQLEREEKGEEIEVGPTPLSPSVPSAVALFQSPASVQTLHGKAQTRGSPKPSKPSNTPRTWDTIQKSCPQEPNNTQVSPNERAGPVTATPVLTTPINNQSEPGGNATAQEDPPPVKVSELKKRFEA
ncbi:DENN domain-containing protein 1B-like isoform X2 [Salvelinus fontinalis]|uniref:DENN domain-containing protein 1B-like isoform X2 n=1 Tax=Salvelinus fontinalis TaxID=8038 RepID=UPI002485E40A|nr:DENN domain-containing protein 1B-like isoform X2 [Salvelinus fontinalis]